MYFFFFFYFAVGNVRLKIFLCINVSVSFISDKKVALLQLSDMPCIGLTGSLQLVMPN